MLLEELKKISETIDKLISEDDFPAGIEPESLAKAVRSYPERGGKRLRPALLMWSCGLLGGSPEKAKFAAAAVEIYHNWTLVHDDIIDNDETRRGLPATHTALKTYACENFNVKTESAERYGRDFAILAGDIQQGWANNMLLKSAEAGVSPELCLALSRRLQELVNRELISGEAIDVEFPYRKRSEIGVEEIERMLYQKTGVLLKFCAEVGAAIALDSSDFERQEIAELGKMASAAGVAFQLRDDWLGIFGEADKLGKPIGSDLSEGKITCLLVSALNGLEAEKRAELEKLIGLPEYSEAQLQRAKNLIRESGAEATILKRAEELANEANQILAGFPKNNYRDCLFEMIGFLVGRDF